MYIFIHALFPKELYSSCWSFIKNVEILVKILCTLILTTLVRNSGSIVNFVQTESKSFSLDIGNLDFFFNFDNCGVLHISVDEDVIILLLSEDRGPTAVSAKKKYLKLDIKGLQYAL